MDWDFLDLFGGGADAVSDVAGGVADLPLPPEFLTEDAAAALYSGAGDAASSGGGFNWGSLLGGLGTVARVATPVAGALMGVSANNSAARTQSDATALAARIQAEALLRAQQMGLDASAIAQDKTLAATREAQDRQEAAAGRGIAAIRAGTQGYSDTIAPLLAERPVMMPTYRGLTQAEQIAREDLQRQGQATLAASGLRGAGRAGVATIMDADRRFVANATQNNDNRRLTALQTARSSADAARTGLATVRAQEGGAIANTEIGQGNRIAETGLSGATSAAGIGLTGARTAADLTGTIGGVNSQAALSQGGIDAGAETANANLWGDALGTIGSVIANAGKAANSDRYSAQDRWI